MYAFRILHLEPPSLEEAAGSHFSYREILCAIFFFIPFLLDTRANNVPKKKKKRPSRQTDDGREEKLRPDIYFKLEINRIIIG